MLSTIYMSLLNDITLGRYVSVDSTVHRLDPRTKLGACMVLMSAILIGDSFLGLIGLLFCLLGITARSNLPYGLVLRNLRPFMWLFMLTFGLHAFRTPGAVLWNVPLIDVGMTAEGLSEGIFLAVRLSTLIIAASLLTLTTSPMELTDGLERLLTPFKRFGVPAYELSAVTSIALRFIPTLMDEAHRIRQAQLARGASFEGGLVKRIKSLIPLLVPLFLSAFRRADRLALAMESRCYKGGEGRTSLVELRFKASDLLAIGTVVLLSIIVITYA